MSTKISIITVNRNNLQGLVRTVESVKSQSFRNFEHIIIDGASTDGSLDLIQRRKEKFSYWVSEADNGIYDAMNKGIFKANGEYCIFLNSGDIFCNRNVLQKIFANPLSVDIVYGDVILSYGNRKLERKSYPDRLEKCFLAFETICHQTTIYRTKYIQDVGGFDLNYKICADYALLTRSVYENKSTEHVPVFISVYDMTGTANDPKNSTLITKERSLIQSNYYTEEEIKLALDAEPIYRDWLKWKSSRFLGFYETWNVRFRKFFTRIRKLFSINAPKQIIFLFLCFLIRRLGLFDEQFYTKQLQAIKIDLPAGTNLAYHYLKHGYFARCEPNINFRGSLISKYFGLESHRIKNPLLYLLFTFRFAYLYRKNSLFTIIQIGNATEIAGNLKVILDHFKIIVAQTIDHTCHFIFSHSVGGGSLKAIDLIIERYSFKKNYILVYPSTEYKDLATIEFKNSNLKLFIKQSDIATLFSELTTHLISSDIRINHLLGFEYLDNFLEKNINLIKDFFLHDYHLICPFLFLSPQAVYCGLPDVQGCNSCLEKNGRNEIEIESYRRKYELLFEAGHINFVAPSNSVVDLFKKIYPLANYSTVPHEKLELPTQKQIQRKKAGIFRIGILGHITLHKGLQLVEYFVNFIRERDLEVKLICIGFTEPKIPNSQYYAETGSYNDLELERVIRDCALDIIWFPVRIPETYSFTLSKVLLSGLPLYVPDIGAFPERTALRENIFRFSHADDMFTIANILIEIKKNFYLNE